MPVTADQTLDCSGLSCPMPIIKTRKALDTLSVGQVLKMIATDPGSQSDMDAFVKKTGHQLLAAEQDAGKFVFFIKKTR